MSIAAVSSSPFEPETERFATSGLPALDAVLGGLRLGDNVVWRVGSVDEYRAFVEPFVVAARADGRRVVYVRFGSHAPVVPDGAASVVHDLDALRGFESFTVRLHTLIGEEGEGVFYVFDCLSTLLDAWATDGMIANFFRVICPYLYELDTVAYFALERGAHSMATVDAIRATTQLLVDLYDDGGVLYLHPLKVWQRSSPTMFLPHRHEQGRFTPVTASSEATSLFARLRARAPAAAERPLDSWERLFERAADLAATEPEGAARQAMVMQLCRLMIGRDARIVQLALRYLRLEDLLEIEERLIGTGFIGGKAVGMLLARAILRADLAAQWNEFLEPHDSYYIGSDLFHSTIVVNGWWPLLMDQRSEAGYFGAAAQLRERLLQATFPAEILREFRVMLEHFGQYPIIVRSSSLLEDGFGNAFAGKYDSFFCVNQGSPEERLEQFVDAVRKVYASTLSDEALQYRLTRGLARRDEQMALLVQRVSGAYHGNWFCPAFAGVGISYNTFVWRHDIDPAAGMLRLVVGLGTRAVDRVEGDYPRVVALDQPLRMPLNDPENRRRFTQHDVDVLDIAHNRWRTIALADLGAGAPTLPLALLAERDGAGWLVTFERLLGRTDFVPTMRKLLATLARAYEYPVDIEFAATFASDGRLRVNLIQCRPLQTRGVQAARVAIGEAGGEQALFRSSGSFMGGSIVAPIARVVAVLPQAYMALDLADKYELARLIGRLNRQVVARDRVPTLLLGPGRWGTSTPRLGVPVRFAEIDAMTAIAEVAFSAGGLHPELSFGTHFFQDLVETGIFYVALDSDRSGCSLDVGWLAAQPNRLAELLPDDSRFADTVRVLEPAGGLRLLADIISQQVVCVRA
ncbi:MAG TPA: PEP/pyruvate-binding domain-containing protein [Burkholderiaceae bacterium]|nr:PEP/pyruvate-binding domain-containing protein [Burkholderiaceae bacterium]